MILLILLIVHKAQIYLQRKAQISSWGHFIDRGPGYAFKSSLIISFAEVFISTKFCKSLLEISSVYVRVCTFQCKLVSPQSKQSLAMMNCRSNLRIQLQRLCVLSLLNENRFLPASSCLETLRQIVVN